MQIQTRDRGTRQVPKGGSHPFWGRGFRPFFLGVGVYGFLVVAAWAAMWRGALPVPVWLAPAWWHGHEMPFGLVAAIDLAFLPGVALVLVRTVWRTRQRRNCGVVVLVGLLALANAAVHAQALGIASGSAPLALRFAVDVVVVLSVVIGGRITPSFTTNGLLRRGVAARASSRPWLDPLAVSAVALLASVQVSTPSPPARWAR